MNNIDNIDNIILQNDRITRINGVDLIRRSHYNINRRNIECYSAEVNDYINNNNLSIDNKHDYKLITNFIYENKIIENRQNLKFIKVIYFG